MTTILRSLDWHDHDNAGFVVTSYEISQDTRTGEGLLRTVCRRDNGADDRTIISVDALPGLLKAYDGNQMDQWINDHAEGMYHGYVE